MSESNSTKTCTTCKATKFVDHFSLRTAAADGRYAWCKECASEYRAIKRATKEGQEKERAHNAKRYATPEGVAKMRAADVARRATPEGGAKLKAQNAKRYATPEGREKMILMRAEWGKTGQGTTKLREQNVRRRSTPEGKAQHRAEARKRYSTPEGCAKIKAAVAAYSATPAGRAVARLVQQKRRAIKKGATIGDQLAIKEWEATWRTAASVACHWCKKLFPGKECHADHVIALTKGGAHSVENLVVACPNCNLTKSAKRPEVFNAEQEQPLLFF